MVTVGAVHQNIRGMPFGAQQPQQGRQLGSRLTNGKMGMFGHPRAFTPFKSFERVLNLP